ncbi:MAG: hypothetical protein AB7G44_10955 [Bacteroidia bacterium]
MEECIKIQNIDITEEFYVDDYKTSTSGASLVKTDLKGLPVIIDVEKYIDPTCCFKLVGVEAKENDKRRMVSISDDGKKILYYPNLRPTVISLSPGPGPTLSTEADDYLGDMLWHCEPEDSFTYCAQDLKTGGHFEGTVTLIGLERDDDFKAADICINLQKLKSDTVQIDVSLFNKYEGIFIAEVGAFNKKYIKEITIDPLNRAKLIIRLNHDCSDWDCCGSGAGFTYKIGQGDPTYGGITSTGRIGLRKCDDPFIARNIIEEVWEPIPTTLQIEVDEYYDEAEIYYDVVVTEVKGLVSERGSATISSDGKIVTYNFNKASGYWDENHAQDIFQYTLKNSNTGKTACAYIIIRKCEMQSGSGSGSGSGGGSIMTLYFSQSSANPIQISGLIPEPPSSNQGNLVSISSVVFKGVPGTHVISGGYIRIQFIGAYDAYSNYYKITFLSGTPLINSVAPINTMQLFVLAAPPSPSISWLVNIVEENPMNSSEDSFIIVS